MSLVQSLYQSVMRRNSSFIAAIFVTAFATEIIVDNSVEAAWRWNNEGVRSVTPFT